MNTVAFRNIEVSIPSGWLEIDKRNLLYLASKFPYSETHGFAMRFLFHSLNLPSRPWLALTIARNFNLSKKLNRDWKNDVLMEYGEENIFETELQIALFQLEYFAWLHKDIRLEKCLMDKFSCRFTSFYGPREYLANVTADEFRHAEFFFIKFYKTGKIYFLDRLIATLWRRKAKGNNTGDIRQPFNEFNIENDVKKIARLSQLYKYACLLTYTGMRNFFVNTPEAKAAFDASEDGSGDVLTNWGIILLRLAENSTFGTTQQTKGSYIHDIILYLADLKQRNEKLKSTT